MTWAIPPTFTRDAYMRTATILLELDAVADASESRIREAVLQAVSRLVITPPGMGIATTEDGKNVRVRTVLLAERPMRTDLHKLLDSYLEGAVNFSELVELLAAYHIRAEQRAADQGNCGNCGRPLAVTRA